MKAITYGQRLRELRKKAELSQSALAKKAGVSLYTLHSHEQNRRMFATDLLFDYCRALGVPCSSFEGCVPPPKPKAAPH